MFMELIRACVGTVGPGGRMVLPLQSLELHESHIGLAKSLFSLPTPSPPHSNLEHLVEHSNKLFGQLQ